MSDPNTMTGRRTLLQDAAKTTAPIAVLPHAACPVCAHYRQRRGVTLAVAIAGRALTRGVDRGGLLDRYLRRVHARHLAGESLSTRHHTPIKRLGGTSTIRVQRSCNGCQKSVGDAHEAEVDAAVAGRPLPDVRLECGCWTEDAA